MFNNIYFICLIATLITWFCVFIGSLVVLINKKVNLENDNITKITSGLLISTMFFALILPTLGTLNVFYMTLFFVIGTFFLYFIDKYLLVDDKKGIILLITMFLHNIPEGLIIGSSIASFGFKISIPVIMGIGFQNIPEGIFISLALLKKCKNIKKSILLSTLVGISEPIFAFVGALLSVRLSFVMPALLLFSSGSILYTSISELTDSKDLYFTFGFVLMMILELIFA